MKKSLLALGLTLSIVLAMATPAFAANANLDGTTDVTKPGHPVYDAQNVQTAGESYNEATITNKAGVTAPTAADWQVANDDDKNAAATDTTADINVWAKVVDGGSKIYKVDLAWGAMKFEFDSGSGKWDTTDHKYTTTGGTAAWTATYLDGVNNNVKVTNHSNNAIDAKFAYAMDSNKPFNDANGTNNVIGNFFENNTAAITASKVLTGTYTDALGNESGIAVSNKLFNSKISLATADAYNSTDGEGTATDTTKNVAAGERSGNVCFAFSGTPDAGKGKTLDTFKKVGVITVTVTPNTSVALNRPTI